MVENEEILITRNGKIVAKIVNPNISAVDSLSGLLVGKIPDDTDRIKLREARLEKYEIDG